MLPTIAEKLGYSTATNGTMWRDAALVALNEVYTHRFAPCQMSQHT
jgi:nitric oxide synthase oxygenase domain/subunit